MRGCQGSIIYNTGVYSQFIIRESKLISDKRKDDKHLRDIGCYNDNS